MTPTLTFVVDYRCRANYVHLTQASRLGAGKFFLFIMERTVTCGSFRYYCVYSASATTCKPIFVKPMFSIVVSLDYTAHSNTHYFMRTHLLFAATVLLLLCTGCSNFQKMPLTDGVTPNITKGQSVQFGRIVIINKNKPEHQPELQEIIVRTKDGRRSFIKPLQVEETDHQGRQYIFSLAIPPWRCHD